MSATVARANEENGAWSRWGVSNDLPPGLARRIVLANQLSLTMAVVTAPYVVVFALAGRQLLSWMVLPIALSYFGCALANRYKAFVLSRVGLITIFNVAIFIYAAALGRAAGLHLLYFAVVVFPFVLFEPRERSKILFGLALPCALLAGLLFGGFSLLPHTQLRGNIAEAISFVVAATTLVIAILGLSYLYRSNVRAEAALEETVALLQRQIVEREGAQRELAVQQSKTVAAAKMAALGQMASGLAHEINNPLAAVLLRAEILGRNAQRGDVPAEDVRRASAAIARIARRIAEIIDGLRSFARDGDEEPVVRASLASLVGETLSFCSERLRNHGIQLRVAPIPPATEIECHPAQVMQVLLNLLNNAHDAAERMDERWVALDTTVDDDGVEVRVSDSGPGIPPSLRDRIMDPFFTTKSPGKGTGLGLSISLGIVERHHGTLRLDAVAPNTTFVLRLPLKQPPSPRGPRS